MEEPQPDPTAVVVPYEDFTDATNAVLVELAALGLGHWVLRPHMPDDPTEALTVPIVLPDGTLLAALKALDVPGESTETALDAAKTMARLLGSIAAAEMRAERAAQLAARAEAASMADTLTGLPNLRSWRATMKREAQRARRSGAHAVIAVIDLDDLKIVNDTHGHLAGDLLLRSAAETIRLTVRRTDTVARLGGDEFGVLAVDYDEPMPDTLLVRLTKALEQEDISASIGAAVHLPEAEIEETLHAADEAMYEDKRQRKAAAPLDT